MPVRLLMRLGRRRLGTIPLVPGPICVIRAKRSKYLSIKLRDWKVHVGTVRGAGDYGSFIELAWRLSNDRPTDFEAPQASHGVLKRLADNPRPWFPDDPRLIQAAQDSAEREIQGHSLKWRGYARRSRDA